MPASFDVPSRIDLSTFDSSQTLSVIGQPPQETDTDGDGVSDIFYERNLKTRAMCIAPSSILPATSGDAKDALYLGCDEQIYKYTPSTDLYTELTQVSDLGPGFYIRYLWHNSLDGYIYGIAYDDLKTDNTVATDWKDWASVTAKIFRYNDFEKLTVLQTISNFFDGKTLYSDGYDSTWSSSNHGRVIGNISSINTGHYNIFIPYSQYVRSFVEGDSFSKYLRVDNNETTTVEADFLSNSAAYSDYTSQFNTIGVQNTATIVNPLGFRYSSGVESKLAQDIEKIEKIINDELPKYEWVISIDEEYIENNGWFSTGKAFIKAILCLYAKQKPKSFDNNLDVIMDNSWLKIASSKNYHHFFPKSWLKKNFKDWDYFYVNHILNITIVDDFLNKRTIKTKSPGVYMKAFRDRKSVV